MRSADRLQHARVSVPCSTSNLGAGFDCIGLALDRQLRAEYTPTTTPLHIERGGTVADLSDAHDHLERVFRDALARAGVHEPTGHIAVTSEIPVARGLGSSAASIVAGLALASAVLRAPFDREAALVRAESLEGHPDNAAPALLGGLVGVARGLEGSARAFRLPLADALGFAFAAPAVEVPTPLARRALPTDVPHALATGGLGRVAALLHGLATADPDLLRIGFDDELHVPYRLPLIPNGAAALSAAVDAGAFAATISGSGSGLIAVCARDSAPHVAQVMAEALADERPGAVSFAAASDTAGARIENL